MLSNARDLVSLNQKHLKSLDRPGERIEAPIGSPICPTGHLYRLAQGEAYPD